jgi:hypothetical protein
MLKLSRPWKQNRGRIIFSVLLFLFLISLPRVIRSNEITNQVDVNTAALEDLIKIIHIGEARALELISLRPFSSLDELTKIKGIGESRIEDIKKQGLAWIGTGIVESSIIKAESQQAITYPSGIIVNELLPSPEGPDNEQEWIELYNSNSFSVLLSDWKLEDSAGKINAFIFPENYQITANGFLLFNRQTTKIVLNNDEDGLKLIQPNEMVVDQITFKNALRGQSYSRTKDNNWLWTSGPTPGAENVIEDLPVKTPDTEQNSAPLKAESNQESPSGPIDLNNQAAAINGSETALNNYYLFCFALLIAFLTGILIFVLKKKLDFKKKLE